MQKTEPLEKRPLRRMPVPPVSGPALNVLALKFPRLSVPAWALLAWALLALPGLATPGQAADAPELKGLTARIQERYEQTRAFTAAFTQTLCNAARGTCKDSAGTLAFSQPHLVRWETTSPTPQLLVVGPEAVWDYQPDEAAAYKYGLDRVLDSKTVLRFLSGQARLEEDFYVEDGGRQDGGAGGLARLILTPKEPEPSMVAAEAWVDRSSAAVVRVLVTDFYGNTNDVRLSDIVVNPDLPEGFFRFTPPAGTAVFDNTAGPAAGG